MTKNIFKRGFTLIELLVVIAIIGILAAVVLASLNAARDKGQDANIKQTITNLRAEAEMHYDDSSASYSGFCGSTTLGTASTSIQEAGGALACNDTGTDGGGAAAGDEYRVSSQLTASTTQYYCADDTGFGGVVNSAPSGSRCN